MLIFVEWFHNIFGIFAMQHKCTVVIVVNLPPSLTLMLFHSVPIIQHANKSHVFVCSPCPYFGSIVCFPPVCIRYWLFLSDAPTTLMQQITIHLVRLFFFKTKNSFNVSPKSSSTHSVIIEKLRQNKWKPLLCDMAKKLVCLNKPSRDKIVKWKNHVCFEVI